MNAPIIVPPITLEERIENHTQWVKLFGVDSLIKQYAEYQQFMSVRCKEHRAAIAELTKQVAGEPKTFAIDDARPPDQSTGFSLFGELM